WIDVDNFHLNFCLTAKSFLILSMIVLNFFTFSLHSLFYKRSVKALFLRLEKKHQLPWFFSD
ncbi:MAG: hypothetical protein LBR43_01420, partial [Spiroplasmataceae bacterium]|nr:hypothetical protein [Spiroplasmataceae bacterium]